MKEFIKDLKKMESVMKKDAASIIGTEEVNYSTENFDNQSLDGKSWKDIKRRDPSSSRSLQ